MRTYINEREIINLKSLEEIYMSKVLNFAIIGCGVIAPSHANAISHVEGAKLYGFVT